MDWRIPMNKCENCNNHIPDGMKICPHCGLLPSKLFPYFYLYMVLTFIAVGCAVHFRPFLGSPAYPKVTMGMLWVSFLIFAVFGCIFLFVSLVMLRNYKNRSFRERLTKQEVIRFVNMKDHIKAGRHSYENGKYCSICGHKK